MKTLRSLSVTLSLVALAWASATGQETDPSKNPPPPAVPAPAVGAATNTAPSPVEQPKPPTPAEAPTPNQPTPAVPLASSLPIPPVTPIADGEKGLRMNFRDVPLDMVLNYLSDAAGFIIVLEAKPEGKVNVWSNQPMDKDEAVDLLNGILSRNGLAALRNGRTLTIVSREDAKKRNIPVKKGSDLEKIGKSDEMITQILPVKHANVAQLVANLQPLLGTYAEMTPNESANSLVLTATEADVRRMSEIVAALDESISGTSIINVFPLKYADAKELANVVKELFTPATQQQQGGNRGGGFRGFGGGGPGGGGFGIPGGFGAGGGGGGGGNRGGSSASAGNANARVVAVADERSNSLVVGAPDDVMETISNVIVKVDQPISDVTELRVFHLENADPMEMADMFTQLFPDPTRSSTDQNQNQGFQFGRGFLGGGGFGQRNNNRGAAGSSSTDSERMKKMGRVVAVPDQRTSSLIVTAAKDLMPEIGEMIAKLDSSPARKQKVFVYNLKNADPQEVEKLLKDMFERTQQNSRNNNANQNSALTTRGSANQNNNATRSSFGNSGGSSGFGGNQGGFGGGGQRGF